MAEFVKKLRAGQTPSDQEWSEQLLEIHRDDPGFTPRAFADLKSWHGQNSYAALAETLTSEKPLWVLDLACGDGHLLGYLHQRLAPGSNVVGVDMSAEELQLARDQHPSTEFVEARADALPFPDLEFDAVVCHMALMLMRPLESVTQEIHRVLKPGGTLAAVVAAPIDDDFLFEIQKICIEFLESSLPGRARARTGDPRAATRTGWQSLFPSWTGFEEKDLILEVDTNPEGVWNLLYGMYFVRFLTPEEQQQLKAKIVGHSTVRAKLGRHIHFEFPLRLLKARKP